MQLITTREAAQRLGVSHGRVKQLVMEKRLPVAGGDGRTNLIDPKDLAKVRNRKRTGRPKSKR